jgi:hypothetical protein
VSVAVLTAPVTLTVNVPFLVVKVMSPANERSDDELPVAWKCPASVPSSKGSWVTVAAVSMLLALN